MDTAPDNTESQEEVLQKTLGTGARIDYMLGRIRDALRNGQMNLLSEYLDKTDTELQKGGDWERKNKLSVYRAMASIIRRDFVTASHLLIRALATFTPCDLLTFRDFVFYTVVSSMLTQDRVVIKTKVLGSPEILSVVREVPHLLPVLTGLQECRYQDFFVHFADLIDVIRCDTFLSKHLRYITKTLRMVAYRQFMMAYTSVTLDSMASSFGISVDFLEGDIFDFIRAGKLKCKIDKMNRYIESNRLEDKRNPSYMSILRHGDQLLNRVQNLSRVIDV